MAEYIVSDKSELKDKVENNLNASNGQSRSVINYDVIIGDKDINGYMIEQIYARMPGYYLIYGISGFDIKVVSKDASMMSKNPDFNKLWMQVSDYLIHDPTLKQNYSKSLAYAVKNLYDGKSETACNSLSSIHESISRYLKRRAIIPYLLGAICPVLISLIAYFFAYKFGNLSSYENIMFSAVILSALGGFLSVGISLSDIKADIQSNFSNHFIYGFVRIIIAMISGIIVYHLIEGKIALSFLKDFQNNSTYYIAFFVSGFSEKLISNMMLSFENKDKKGLEAR